MNEDLFNFADDNTDEIEQTKGIERFGEAVLYGTDWTVGTIIQQLELGNIDIAPDFQRRDAWDPKKKSKFIESVALSLPIPQIVLAERKEQRGTYIVLDGKQRLLTLAQFAANLDPEHDIVREYRSLKPLKLSGLEIIKQFNGQTYGDIKNDPNLRRIITQFENHTIRSSLIRNWPDEEYLYEVFIRLNTGSTKLSPQELRQALKPGPFANFLIERSSKSSQLQNILGLKGPDFRMRDVELLLRLISFSYRPEEYRGSLKTFLDETLEIFNNDWLELSTHAENIAFAIEAAIDLVKSKFSSYSLVGRRWMNETYESTINRAILDIQIQLLIDKKNYSIFEKIDSNDLESGYKTLCEQNMAFIESISGTTQSVKAVKTRHDAWVSMLEKISQEKFIHVTQPNV